MTPLTRRSLLRAAAGLGAGLPLLDSLRGPAFGQAMAYPRRLILFFSACGTLYPKWVPTGTETNFTLSPLLQPLEPYKQDIVVVDKLALGSAITSPGDGHAPGIGTLWTGIELLQGNQIGGAGMTAGWAGGISVDQLIANTLYDRGVHTPFRSVELGIKADASDNHGRMIAAGADMPIAPENNPRAAFDRLFGPFGGDSMALQKLQARRQKVVDVVQAQLQSVRPRVAQQDRLKIDQHLAALSSLEASLDVTVQPTTCALPAAPPTAPLYSWFLDAQYPTVATQQMQIAVEALKCDLTRVVSLQFGHSQDDTIFSFLGQTEAHHDLSHTPPSDMVSQAKLQAINVWYAERFAELLGMLKAIPEGNGTMLDNTLVVWGNELEQGDIHARVRMPFVVGGRAGGSIATGRFLTRAQQAWHNPLLVSMCHAMGLTDITQVGKPAYNSGPLPGLVS